MVQEKANIVLDNQLNLFEEYNQQLNTNANSEKFNMQSRNNPLINLDRYLAFCINRGYEPGHFKSLDKYIRAERESEKFLLTRWKTLNGPFGWWIKLKVFLFFLLI